MTDSSSETTSQSETGPGALTKPTVQGITQVLNPLIANSGITPTQQTAINQLTANGMAGDPYAAAEGANANNLLSGGGATSQNGNLSSNLSTLQNTLAPYTAPNYSTVNSPDVQRALQAANAGITNQVNGEFAAAGRSGSGANQGTLAYNEENADAPILLNQANTDPALSVRSVDLKTPFSVCFASWSKPRARYLPLPLQTLVCQPTPGGCAQKMKVCAHSRHGWQSHQSLSTLLEPVESCHYGYRPRC